MRARTGAILVGLVLGAAAMVLADEAERDEETLPMPWEDPASLLKHETLTANWFGLGDMLEERGIVIMLGVTQVYQVNVKGGLGASQRRRRLRLHHADRNRLRVVLQRASHALAEHHPRCPSSHQPRR